jgi:hypothetical protein
VDGLGALGCRAHPETMFLFDQTARAKLQSAAQLSSDLLLTSHGAFISVSEIAFHAAAGIRAERLYCPNRFVT